MPPASTAAGDPGCRPRAARPGSATGPRSRGTSAGARAAAWARLVERGERLDEPLAPRLLLGEPRLLLGDDVVRRLGEEVGVAELLLERADLLVGLADVARDPRLLGRDVDQAAERHHDLDVGADDCLGGIGRRRAPTVDGRDRRLDLG